MNITFIAPPAAGKGTQAKKVSEKYDLEHISTGDLLRSTNNDEIKKIIKNGEFISDEFIGKLLKEKLQSLPKNKGFVLDGYPRTIAQAKTYKQILNDLNIKMGIIIALDIDKQIALKRIIGRRICPNCGRVFNDIFSDTASKEKGVCDSCHTKLIKREDDTEEVYEKRYQIYQKETAPLLDYFKEYVYHVDSSINAEYTFKQIKDIIGGVYDKY